MKYLLIISTSFSFLLSAQAATNATQTIKDICEIASANAFGYESKEAPIKGSRLNSKELRLAKQCEAESHTKVAKKNNLEIGLYICNRHTGGDAIRERSCLKYLARKYDEASTKKHNLCLKNHRNKSKPSKADREQIAKDNICITKSIAASNTASKSLTNTRSLPVLPKGNYR